MSKKNSSIKESAEKKVIYDLHRLEEATIPKLGSVKCNIPYDVYFTKPTNYRNEELYKEISKVNKYLPDTALWDMEERLLGYPYTFFVDDKVVNRHTGESTFIRDIDVKFSTQAQLREMFKKELHEQENG